MRPRVFSAVSASDPVPSAVEGRDTLAEKNSSVSLFTAEGCADCIVDLTAK